ncbi:MAG: sulfate ABC transporter permease subunit [Nocardioides sp.]|nr:sulfate ABC transporter permease subunit [Nocardioides sp.]
MLVIWPTFYVVKNTFADGWDGITTALGDSDVISALQLSLIVAVSAVVINLVFGVGISLLLVRSDFPGKRLLSAFLDLPLAVSPVVVGLALMLVYSPTYGWFGKPLDGVGIEIVFAKPAMIMATCFVALPLVIREIVPVLEEVGDDQEQAAQSLGASAWQTFWRVTLPSIKWAIIYGVVLSLARSLGEFGAVKVVSGNVTGESQTATQLVQAKYQGFEQTTAYVVAFLLAFASVLCLAIVFGLRARGARHR